MALSELILPKSISVPSPIVITMPVSAPSEVVETLVDRSSSLLTKSQRDFVLNQYDDLDYRKENGDTTKDELKNRRQRLYKIRQRVINGIIDFGILHSLRHKDLEGIFHPNSDRPPEKEYEFQKGLRSIIKLITQMMGPEWVLDQVEFEVEQGVNPKASPFGEGEPSTYRNVEISLDVTEESLEDLISKYESGEDLTFGQIDVLYRYGGYEEPMNEVIEEAAKQEDELPYDTLDTEDLPGGPDLELTELSSTEEIE